MEKLTRPKIIGKENERQKTLTSFATLWQCSCHSKARCNRFSFKCFRIEHQQEFQRKAPFCTLRECTKVFCKKTPQKQKNQQMFSDSMPLQSCSVSSVSNDGNCPAVMKISTWESHENSCRMQCIPLRAQQMTLWHKADLYGEDSFLWVLLLSFTAKFSHRRNWKKKKKRQKVFWYPKHKSSPESLHNDVNENCKQMRRI